MPKSTWVKLVHFRPKYLVHFARNRHQGYKISFVDNDISITQKEIREIKAVLIDFYGVICIAPKIIDKKPRWSGNPLIKNLDGDVKEIRPGCKILGGRDSGFYDDYGVILENKWIGGDVNKFEDWMFYVLSPDDWTASIVPNWILLDDIRSVVSSPEFSVNFDELNDKEILQLLENSNSEILEYYHNHPEKIETMNARYFEHFIKSVYINNGFAVEKVGNWNQADGGIDLIAISKFINNEIKILIQCKTSINKISAKPIRELNGVLDVFKAHKGIVATTSRFTKEAI